MTDGAVRHAVARTKGIVSYRSAGSGSPTVDLRRVVAHVDVSKGALI